MSDLMHAGVGTLALLAYALISLRVGDRFPFSRYSMYASLKGRVEGARLAVCVGGQEVSPTELHAFVGIDPERISPRGYPCSQEWVVHEVRRWIADHQAQEALAGAVDVEVGFRIISMSEFKLSERWVVLAAGKASRRSA